MRIAECAPLDDFVQSTVAEDLPQGVYFFLPDFRLPLLKARRSHILNFATPRADIGGRRAFYFDCVEEGDEEQGALLSKIRMCDGYRVRAGALVAGRQKGSGRAASGRDAPPSGREEL